MLFDLAAGELSSETLEAIAHNAETLFAQFIAADSALEVNITSRRRREIKANLDAFLERLGPRSPSEEAAEQAKPVAELELQPMHHRRDSASELHGTWLVKSLHSRFF